MAVLGSSALALYAAAIVGVGIAVGGAWKTSVAAEVAALVVVATGAWPSNPGRSALSLDRAPPTMEGAKRRR